MARADRTSAAYHTRASARHWMAPKSTQNLSQVTSFSSYWAMNGAASAGVRVMRRDARRLGGGDWGGDAAGSMTTDSTSARRLRTLAVRYAAATRPKPLQARRR